MSGVKYNYRSQVEGIVPLILQQYVRIRVEVFSGSDSPGTLSDPKVCTRVGSVAGLCRDQMLVFHKRMICGVAMEKLLTDLCRVEDACMAVQ